MIASVADEIYRSISTEPWSFLCGALVGFFVSNRWKLSRRNDKEAKE